MERGRSDVRQGWRGFCVWGKTLVGPKDTAKTVTAEHTMARGTGGADSRGALWCARGGI